jgi:hypothetical protein
MNALFAAQSQTSASSASSSLASQLFSLLDTNGDGSISKSELEATLGQNGNTAAADSLFAKLDANGDARRPGGSRAPCSRRSTIMATTIGGRRGERLPAARHRRAARTILGAGNRSDRPQIDGSTTTTRAMRTARRSP